MRTEPLSPLEVLRALELFGPQARPYNFDDCFDCWGLMRRVFDHLDDGFELDGELAEQPGGPQEAGWAAFEHPDELTPGDLLVTHPHVSKEFHTVVYCGQAAGLHLVYDASPRGEVPLFARRAGAPDGRPGDVWELEEARAISTLYARATETTDRLRNDGGAYLRLWDDRERYYHRGLRARLVAGVAADPALAGSEAALGRDLVMLRRAAGLGDLPFYCRRRLPQDAAGRELYDNRWTRRLDYYVPDGAPVPDDAYEAAAEAYGGAVSRESPPAPPSARAPGPRPGRPGPPRIFKAPVWVVRDGPVKVEWEYPAAGEAADAGGQDASGDSSGAAVTGCRIEVWEETADLWKHRLLRLDLDRPETTFEVPVDLLRDDRRFAVVVWARGPGGFSGTALAPFLYRPGRDAPLLAYQPIRPEELAPDGGEEVPAGAPLELTWRIRQPLVTQAGFRVSVLEDALPEDDATPVFDLEVKGAQARICKAVVPGDVLRAGHVYRWYVTVRTADGRTAFAPSEGMVRAAAATGKG